MCLRTLVQRLYSSRGSPHSRERNAQRCVTRATLPGTGNAGALRSLADPVASLSRVRPSQRAQRSGLRLRARLEVRANPSRKRAPVMRPDSRGTGGQPPRCLVPRWPDALSGRRGNAVMPLDVLGRTRATLTGPASTPLAGRPG